MVVLIASALALRVAATRPERTVSLGALAVVLVLLSILLQVIEWTTLGFGAASGGYASVYIGWTAFYAVFTLPCAFWIETQVATAWRRSREQVRGTEPASPADVYTSPEVIKAGIDACSFFWSFYVFTGVVLFVCLYLL